MSREYLTEKADFNAHVGNKSNPHGVTADQVGAVQWSNITSPVDFDTLYVLGKTVIYNVTVTGGANRPDENYGILIASACGTKKQIYIPDINDNIYSRCGNGLWVSYAIRSELANYLPLSGGIVSGTLDFTAGRYLYDGLITPVLKGIMGGNDFWRIGTGATAVDEGFVEFSTADNGNEPIYIRQYTGEFTNLIRTLTLLDANGNSSFPGGVTVGNPAPGTQAVRNIYAGTGDMAANSTALATGLIYLVYE